jgi:hypothetical protein
MLEIAIFPLHTVLFPEGLLALKIFEQRYLDMTKDCIRDGAPFGVCLIRDGAEVGAPAVPYPTGCLARIVQWDMPHLGVFQLSCRGERVFRIGEHWTLASGLLRAQVQLSDPPARLALPREHRPVAELLDRIIRKLGAEHFPAPIQLEDADWVACRLAEVLPLEATFKQELLEADGALARVELLSEFLRTRSVVV